MQKFREMKSNAWDYYQDFKQTKSGRIVVNVMKYYSIIIPICFLIAAHDELKAPMYWGRQARKLLGHQSPEEFMFFTAHRSAGRDLTKEEAASFWSDLEIPVYYEDYPDQKEFMVNHVTRFQPGVFKGMANDWPAIENWNDGNNFVKEYGQEVVSVYKFLRDQESQGKFGLFFKDMKKSWMYLEDFMPRMPSMSQENNLVMNIYEHPMLPSFDHQYTRPTVVDQLLDYIESTFTILPRGHRDMMHYQQERDQLYCLAAGRQNFTFINPFQRDMMYPGGAVYREGQRPRSIPNNYSPVDQDIPQANGKYPIFGHIRYKEQIVLERGDCVYIPAYYWYGSNNFAGMSIGFTFWYDISSEWARMMFKGLEDKTM